MYSIEKAGYGFKLTFGGFIQADEMRAWVEESKKALSAAPANFSVFIDMRTLKPLPKESQPIMGEGQKLFKAKGMQRSVVILNDTITTVQFRRIAKETGIDAWERYIDASKITNWKEAGEAWLTKSQEPA